MKKFEIENSGVTYKRIGKRAAARAYSLGLTVMVCPVNLRPFTEWHCEYALNLWNNRRENFESFLREFETYNCNSKETGHYAAFYVPVREVDKKVEYDFSWRKSFTAEKKSEVFYNHILG